MQNPPQMLPNLFPQQRAASTQRRRTEPTDQLGLNDDGASAQYLLAQHFGLDLAKLGFRKRIEEQHARGDHALVEIRPAMQKDIFLRNSRLLCRNDTRNHLFAKQGMRHSNDGTLPNTKAQ